MRGEKMKKNRYIVYVLLLVMGLGLTGCIGVNRGFRELRNDVLENIDGNYKKEIEFSVGPAAIWLAGLFVQFADTEEPVEEYLHNVSRVQVSVFENHSKGSNGLTFTKLREICNEMEMRKWNCIVRTVDGDESTAVFVRSADPDELNQMFVIALSDEELVLVEIMGDLDRLIEVAIREHGLNMKMAKN
jgi:hypothetical protein